MLKRLSSGDEFIDKFIQEVQQNGNTLKWLPYDGFENVKYLDKGGFSTIYTANWDYHKLVLKSLNPNEDLSELLNEVQYNIYYFIYFFNLNYLKTFAIYYQ